MQTTSICGSELNVSRLAYGCWRIAPDEASVREPARAAILAAVDAGYTLFDHADIYCQGRSETAFGRVLAEVSGLRERVVIATKCGVRPANTPQPGAPSRYDLSAEHIERSCEGSLRRLGVERIDIYQLHRPDLLLDPHEVAGAFDRLHQQGKVRWFGVSNFAPSLVKALQAALSKPLVVNQIEISLANLTAFEDGTLDQCLSERIAPLAWSPLGAGLLADGAHDLLPGQRGYQVSAVVELLDKLAPSYGTTRAGLALAWLLKHPSRIIPIVGSTDPARIKASAGAADVAITREDWYRLFVAARGKPLA